MKILTVFGRTVSREALNNLNLLKKLSDNNPELDLLRSSLWMFLDFNKDIRETFTKNYFTGATTLRGSERPVGEDSNLWTIIKEIHPKYKSLSKKTLSHFFNIIYYLDTVAGLLVTDNGENRGRPAFSVLAAKHLFVPHIDLHSKRVKDKLNSMEKFFELEKKKDNKKLIKLFKPLANKSKVGFKPNKEKIKSLTRRGIHKIINDLETIQYAKD